MPRDFLINRSMMKDIEQLEFIYESIQESNKIKFVRFGGLSPRTHKRKNFESDFHRPPVKYGIFAFIYPYIEPFLAAWKYPDGKLPKAKMFNHHGLVWTHMIEPARQLGVAIDVKDSWALIDTKDLPKVLTKQKSIDATEAKGMYASGMMTGKRDVEKIEQIKDPYKRGRGGFISMDHLEVFIPEKIKETR
jgi:hypothetical protein